MRYRRVSVIGASGFIGRYVVKRLASRGAVVGAIGRHADDAAFLRPMGDVGQVVPVMANIADEELVRAAIAGSDAVVNLAGILYEKGGQTFERVHHEGAARVARLAKATGARQLVHVSALGADPASPSAYARTKAAGEAAVRAAFPEAVILRPSVVFGPEDEFFNRFAAMARMSPVLPLIGGGKTRLQPVYVGDVADAVVKALELPEAAGRSYELGGPRVYTFKELMELLLAEIRRKRRLVSISFSLAAFEARFLELLPKPPLTRDQVELLKRDVIVHPGAATLADLGIVPTAVEIILPTYMDRFRKGGWFDAHRMSRAR
jgi:NADH dehydrogenase